MDLIETLSKGLVFHLRIILNLPKISEIDSNVVGGKNNGIYCEYFCINYFTLRNNILKIDFDEFQKTLTKKNTMGSEFHNTRFYVVN